MERVRQIPALDVTKFVLSILVVAIHVEPFTGNLAFYYNHCIARIADPLFFAVSAYCLFARLVKNQWAPEIFRTYMRRIALLYGGWTLVYFPVILRECSIEAGETGNIGILILKRVLLSGPYGPLWFLTALLLAIPLTYVFIRKGLLKTVFFLSFLFYLLTVVWMEYRTLAQGCFWIVKLAGTGEQIFGWLGNGLNYGWLFCSIGAAAAILQEKCRRSQLQYAIFSGISVMLLAVECSYIRFAGCGVSYGAMFMLIPVTYYVLQLLIHTNWRERKAFRVCRKLSVLIFVLHYGVMEGLELLYTGWETYGELTVFPYLQVLIVTICIAMGILVLSQKRYFRWLRYFY